MILTEEVYGILSVCVSLGAAFFYLNSIYVGKTRPHFCTHIVWALSSLIVCLAQASEEAGPGAWVTTLNTVFFGITALLSLRVGERTITKGDLLAMSLALLAIIPWLLTDNPLWSVILITGIDMLAYYPTLRKSWNKPGEENMTTYGLSSIEYGLSVPAMQVANLTTLLYPLAIIAGNTVLIALCIWRRHALREA